MNTLADVDKRGSKVAGDEVVEGDGGEPEKANDLDADVVGDFTVSFS